MLFKGTLIGPTSGKLNGIVASHNRGGAYFRKLSIPTNRNTTQQITVRERLATLAATWKTLLAADRATWDGYAASTPVINALGDSSLLSGFNWYVAVSTSRSQAGLPLLTVAPPTPGLGILSLCTATPPAEGAPLIALTFDPTDAWATAAGGALSAYVSAVVSAGKSWFRGPYRYGSSKLGAAVAPTPPFTVTLPFGPLPMGSAGSKLFLRLRAVDSVGRLTSEQQIVTTIV